MDPLVLEHLPLLSPLEVLLLLLDLVLLLDLSLLLDLLILSYQLHLLDLLDLGHQWLLCLLEDPLGPVDPLLQ